VIIEPFAVDQTDFIQSFRDSEHYMVMLNGICIIDTVFNPESLFCALAFGTVTIPAAVIADMFASTMITTIFMTAQSCSPACG
jgi:hypothetical protein